MKRLLVGLMVLWSVAAVVQAVEMGGREVPTTVDLTYTTKYIWRGFDILDDVSAWQPSINFDLGNGFSANVWMSYAGSGGLAYGTTSRVNLTEYNYTLAYSGTTYENCPWRTNYSIGWRYYDYIDTDSEDNDVQEVFLTGEMPDLLENGIVPHFAVFKMWPAHSDADGFAFDYAGTIYLAGFSYDFNAEQIACLNIGDLPLTFGWDIVYNDGTGGPAVDSDWSHMVWSLKTSIDCPMSGAKIVPAIYFQNSFDDSVNTEDELWASLSYRFNF
jgi:hypothetical protein